VKTLGLFFQGDELLILFVILVLILGPSKIPQLARGIGQAVREFKKASQGLYDELEQSATRPIMVKEERFRENIREVDKSSENASIDPELVKKLAEKLGISPDGKTQEELTKEVVAKAKEKGLI